MNILKKTIIGVTFIFLSGCSTTATMYPVEGPFFNAKKVQGITATIDGITGNDGNLTVTLPDGEALAGRWSVIAPKSVTTNWGNLFTSYGNMFGNSVSTSTLARTNKGQAYLVGENGTTMDVEFSVGAGTADGFGIGKDSNGNVYKILF